MPYSIDKSFYFVRISKTAGMYLMEALRDAIPDVVDAKHNYFPPIEVDGERHGDHIWISDLYESFYGSNASKYKDYSIDTNILNGLNKFAVVRNPYTRTLSLFSFFRRHSGEIYTPKMFENDVMNVEERFKSYHLNQSNFICKKNTDELLVDKLIKVEHNLLKTVGDYIGVELKQIEKVNVTKSRTLQDKEFFTNPLVIEKISEYFEKDFRVLGYLDSDFPK